MRKFKIYYPFIFLISLFFLSSNLAFSQVQENSIVHDDPNNRMKYLHKPLKGLTVLSKKCIRKLIAATKNGQNAKFVETDPDCVEQEFVPPYKYYKCNGRSFRFLGSKWGNLQNFPERMIKGLLPKTSIKSTCNIVGGNKIDVPVDVYYSYTKAGFGTGYVDHNKLAKVYSFKFTGETNDHFTFVRAKATTYTNDTDGFLVMYFNKHGKRIYKYTTTSEWTSIYELGKNNNAIDRTNAPPKKGTLYAVAVISSDNVQEYNNVNTIHDYLTLLATQKIVCKITLDPSFNKNNVYLIRGGKVSSLVENSKSATIPLNIEVASQVGSALSLKVNNAPNTKVGGLDYSELFAKDAIKVWSVKNNQELTDYGKVKPNSFEVIEKFSGPKTAQFDFNVGIAMDNFKAKDRDFRIVLDAELDCEHH